jgi:hypothetical protein
MLPIEPMSCLAPLIIVEATRSLCAAQGFFAPMDVVVRLSPPGGPESVIATERR